MVSRGNFFSVRRRQKMLITLKEKDYYLLPD